MLEKAQPPQKGVDRETTQRVFPSWYNAESSSDFDVPVVLGDVVVAMSLISKDVVGTDEVAENTNLEGLVL